MRYDEPLFEELADRFDNPARPAEPVLLIARTPAGEPIATATPGLGLAEAVLLLVRVAESLEGLRALQDAGRIPRRWPADPTTVIFRQPRRDVRPI